MELRDVLLCDYFELEPSGRFYVGGGFSQIVQPYYPAPIGDKLLVISVDADSSESEPAVTVDIRLHGEDRPLASVPFDFPPVETAREDEALCRYLRIGLSDIVLPVRGSYYFDVYLGDRARRSVRFLALTPDVVEGAA